MKEFRNVSDHPDDLEDGRVIGIGETFTLDDDQLKSEFNRSKINMGTFLDITGYNPDEIEDQSPNRQQLMDRAGELDITGRSKMRNDELQTAIIAAEQEKGGSS